MKDLFVKTILTALALVTTTAVLADDSDERKTMVAAMTGSNPDEVEVPYDMPYPDGTIISIEPTDVFVAGMSGSSTNIPALKRIKYTGEEAANTADLANHEYYQKLPFKPSDWKEAFSVVQHSSNKKGFEKLEGYFVIFNDVADPGTKEYSYTGRWGYNDQGSWDFIPSSYALSYHVYASRYENETGTLYPSSARDKDMLLLPSMYNPRFLRTLYHEDILNATHDAPYETKNIRQNIFHTMVATATANVEGFKRGDYVIFGGNRIYEMNPIGLTPDYITTLDALPVATELRGTVQDLMPITWDAMTYDFDGNGRIDVLGFCQAGLNSAPEFYGVYLPDGDPEKAIVRKLNSQAVPSGGFMPVGIDLVYPNGQSNGQGKIVFAYSAYVTNGSSDGRNVTYYTKACEIADVYAAFTGSETTVGLLDDVKELYTIDNAPGLDPVNLVVGYPQGNANTAYVMVGTRFFSLDAESNVFTQRAELDATKYGMLNGFADITRTVTNANGETSLLNEQSFLLAVRQMNGKEETGSAVIAVNFDANFTMSTKDIASEPSTEEAIVIAPCYSPGMQLSFKQKYFTATNPVIKYLMAIPPYDMTVDRSSSTAPKMATVQCQMAETSGKSDAYTKTNTSAYGVSASLNICKVIKIGADVEMSTSTGSSKTTTYSTTSTRGYDAGERQNVVVFNYLPAYTFEYEVTAAANPELVGQPIAFYMGRSDESGYIPESMWTQASYNAYVSGNDVMHITHDIFPHTVGSLDNYRRVSSAATNDEIRAMFPVKKDGFFAVGPICTTGDGGATMTSLSISDGKSEGSSSGETTKGSVSFGFDIPLGESSSTLGFGFKGTWSESETWNVTTNWSNSVSMSGRVPYTPLSDTYNFREVWYEYADEDTGQDFLVTDWVMVDYTRVPVSANLTVTDIFTGTDEETGNNYYMPQLNWNIVSNGEIDGCALEYKITGMNMYRDDESWDGEVILNASTLVDWKEIDKVLGGEEWVDTNYLVTDKPTFKTYEYFDLFSLTADQRSELRDAVRMGRNIYIQYRVRADYHGTSVYSNEVASLLFRASSWKDLSTSIEDVQAPATSSAKPVYYTLQGLQVDYSSAAPGIYVMVCGGKATKVVKR